MRPVNGSQNRVTRFQDRPNLDLGGHPPRLPIKRLQEHMGGMTVELVTY